MTSTFSKTPKKNRNSRTQSSPTKKSRHSATKKTLHNNSNVSQDDLKQNLPAEKPTLNISLSSGSKHNMRQRRYYLPKETLQNLKKDKTLVSNIKKQFSDIDAQFAIDYNAGQAVIQMKKMDNERTLKLLQENVGIVITEAEFARLVEELISIERNRADLTTDPSQTITNVLLAISNGVSFVKHSAYAKPKKQWFAFDNDRLYWKEKKNNPNQLNRSIEMKSIVKVRPGKTTKLLKSNKCSRVKGDNCMSIVGVRKTLDLECKSRAERDEWFTYIEFAHRHWVRAKHKTIHLEKNDIALNELMEDID